MPNESLKQMLRYIENTTFENAVNDDLKEVHRMVEMLKIDSETTIYCVRLMEKIERSRKEGEAIGEARGEARGKAEGETIGEARGKAEGDLRRLVTQVCKKMKLGQSLEKIAEDLVEEVSAIEPIYNMAGKYAPEYDPKSVMEELAAAETLNTAGVNLAEFDKIKK